MSDTLVSAPAGITGIRPGLRVMISGAGSGIGRAIAAAFVTHGAKVHICDVAQNHLDDCLAAHPGVGGVIADAGDPDQMAAWFEAAQKHLGGLDVLVNNAGIAGPSKAIEDISIDEWRRTIDIDINGLFYCSRIGVPLLKAAAAEHGEASIINLSSIAGKFGFSHRTPYAFAKWGVVGFTKSLAIELGGHGIRVNALQPGAVAGPRLESVIAGKAKATGQSEDVVRAGMLADTSLNRFVTNEDIADMALFLCSPLARNVSGQAISICGDIQKMP